MEWRDNLSGEWSVKFNGQFFLLVLGERSFFFFFSLNKENIFFLLVLIRRIFFSFYSVFHN